MPRIGVVRLGCLLVLALGMTLSLPLAAQPEAPAPAADHQPEAQQNGSTAENGTEAAAEAEAAEPKHGHSSHAEHVPHFSDINWFYGMLWAREGVEPSLLFRPKGMPPPLMATLLNWAVLVVLLVGWAKKRLPAALAKRKATIEASMQEAGRLKDDSARQLAEYQAKLAHLDDDIERIKSEMKRTGEAERERILAEAAERRERIERDARRVIDAEMEATKLTLHHEVIAKAMEIARASIAAQASAKDQDRLFDDALADVKRLPSRSLGGSS